MINQFQLQLFLIGLLGWSATGLAMGLAAGTPNGNANGLHPVSIVQADVYVNRLKTTVRLKAFAEDLELLQGVEPNEDGFYDREELLDATQDQAHYLAERIEFIDSNGKKMIPTITEIIDIEFPEEGEIRSGHLMNYLIGFVFEFKHDQPPEFITINQKMVAEGALLPSELKILLKQAGSDTPYTHMMKPDQPETFRFDWDKPVLSSEASDKEWEEWFSDQREKTLGITSYSSVYSFIYITHHEVRHEILIPLATLATMIDFERADEYFLDISEQDAAREKIEALFSVGNEVEIDSVVVKPVFDRVDFYGLDLSDFAMQAERRKISMANGRVGLILSYSTKGNPLDVKVTWDKFNPAIKTVDSVIFAFDKVLKTEFTMFLEDNTYHWTEPDRPPLPAITGVSSSIDPESYRQPKLNIPLVSSAFGVIGLLILLGNLAVGGRWLVAGLTAAACFSIAFFALPYAVQQVDDPFRTRKPFDLPQADADQIFSQLHKNLFRAFDYHRESDIYDALANSVDGDLLRKLYLDINDSLKVEEQGGAVSRIDEVNVIEGKKSTVDYEPNDQGPLFGYRAKWDLTGTIEHWGHIHQRVNQYDAEFEIALRDDAWKITSFRVVDEPIQGQIKTSVRKF